MSRVTPDDIHHVAKLARLAFDEAEVADFVRQFNEILDHIDQLSELKTESVEATTQVGPSALGGGTPLRADEPRSEPLIQLEDVLKQAPKRQDAYFVVPDVIENGEG